MITNHYTIKESARVLIMERKTNKLAQAMTIYRTIEVTWQILALLLITWSRFTMIHFLPQLVRSKLATTLPFTAKCILCRHALQFPVDYCHHIPFSIFVRSWTLGDPFLIRIMLRHVSFIRFNLGSSTLKIQANCAECRSESIAISSAPSLIFWPATPCTWALSASFARAKLIRSRLSNSKEIAAFLAPHPQRRSSPLLALYAKRSFSAELHSSSTTWLHVQHSQPLCPPLYSFAMMLERIVVNALERDLHVIAE